MAETAKQKEELAPLDIKCTSADCGKNLHCFQSTPKMKKNGTKGCRYCGANLIDWGRVSQRDISDVDHTFQALKYELIRHAYWHKDIDEKADAHARRKGKAEMAIAAEKRIRKSVGPAFPAWDNRQTPFKGNILFYAQHATATCCRRCIEEWHGIPKGRELTDTEISYFAQLLMLYVQDRMPDLSEEKQRVPRKKKPKPSPDEQPLLIECVDEGAELDSQEE